MTRNAPQRRPAVESDNSNKPLMLPAEYLRGATSVQTRGYESSVAPQMNPVQNERLLSEFAGLSSEWFWELDSDLRYCYLSDRFAEITGFPRDSVLDKTDRQAGLSSRDASVSEDHSALLNSRRSFRNVVFTLERPDGSRINISTSGEPIFDESGRFTGYRGVGRATSDNTDVYKAIQNTRATYQRIGRFANLGNWEWDEVADKCIYCSSYLANIHGISVEEYLRISTSNEADRRWIHPEDHARFEAAIKKFRVDLTEFEIDYRLVRADERVAYVSEVISPVLDNCGKLLRSIGYVRDISERKKSSENLRRAHNELEAHVCERTAELQKVNSELRESERRLKEAASIARLGYFKRDLSGNKGFECDGELAKLLGLSISECNAYRIKDFLGLVHPDDRIHFESSHRNCCSKPDPIELDYRIMKENGEVRYVREVAHPKFHEAGSPAFVFGTLQDITERKQISEQLEQSEERFYEFGARAKEVYWILSADWRHLIYISPSYERVFGRSCQSVRDDPLSWINSVHEDDREQLLQQMQVKLKDRRSGPNLMLYRIVRPDGEIRWLRCRVYRVFNSNGEVARYTGFAEDVTEYEKAEEDLRQAQKMDAVGKLTGGVAHDFNNLLAVIVGNAELMSGRVLPEDEALVDDIVAAGEYGAELTRRLLAFSRKQPIQPRSIDVNKLITDMATLLRRTLGTTIIVELSLGARSAIVLVDPNLLKNALLNLALNSRDAMPDGGNLWIETFDSVEPRESAMERNDSRSSDYVSVVVRDDGRGMPSDVLACALEPFFSTKEANHGRGMGLPMVYGFVKQSQGDLVIESEHRTGTKVTVSLPRCPSTQG